jgi:hypothetical protein
MNSKKSYVVIESWMVDAGLKGTELLTYAVIYGYSQDSRGCFFGSQKYLAYWTGGSERSVRMALTSLLRKGLLKKIEVGYNRSQYMAVLPEDAHPAKPGKNSSDKSHSNSNTMRKSLPHDEEKISASMRKKLPHDEEIFSARTNNINILNINNTRQTAKAGPAEESIKHPDQVPTLEAVIAYARSKNLHVPPEIFFLKNAERSWCDKNGNPIRDWQKLFLEWDRKENPVKTSGLRAAEFQQNTYDFDELERVLLRN